jgi:toxin ParE1/3/4
MKIIWSDFSSEILVDIITYYKQNISISVAKNVKSTIFEATRSLINHPEIGQIEESLKQLNEGHRYLVEGNYKIIYKQVKEGILITDVFDTRQDPVKINDPKRKPGR